MKLGIYFIHLTFADPVVSVAAEPTFLQAELLTHKDQIRFE